MLVVSQRLPRIARQQLSHSMCCVSKKLERSNFSFYAHFFADAPRFQELNNVTRLLDYAVNSSFSLYCTLNSTGNPPSAGFRYINATKEFSNVNATVVGNTSLSYEVTQATVRNRVNLTCIANSSYATTTLTYLAFVGGKTIEKLCVFE